MTAPTDAIDVTALPDNHLACRSCGRPVPPPHRGLYRVKIGTEWTHPLGLGGYQHLRAEYAEYAECRRCAVRRMRAHRIARGVTGDRLAAALTAAAAVDAALPDPLPPVTMTALLDHLPAVAWSDLARPGVYPSEPWGHVSDAQRAAIRAGLSAALRDRLAAADPDVPLPPPDHHACLMCGRAAITRPALTVARAGGPVAAANDVWRRVTTSRRALGGTGGGRVTGYLCNVCADAVDRHGIGPTAIARSIATEVAPDLLRSRAIATGDLRLAGARPWAVTTAAPGEPWAHLGGADEVAAVLRDAAAMPPDPPAYRPPVRKAEPAPAPARRRRKKAAPAATARATATPAREARPAEKAKESKKRRPPSDPLRAMTF